FFGSTLRVRCPAMRENKSKDFEFFRNLTQGAGLWHVLSDSDVIKQWNRYRKNHLDRYLDLPDTHLSHDDDGGLIGLDLGSCHLLQPYSVLPAWKRGKFNESHL